MRKQTKAFSLVEIIIGIMIFLIGVASVYAVMHSTMNVNSYNRDYIIATNLAREQIELVRNIRDTNFAKIQAYNILEPNGTDFGKIFTLGNIYRISNDFSKNTQEPVKIESITTSFKKENLSSMSAYQVCRDTENDLYDYCKNISGEKVLTNFYKYIEIQDVTDIDKKTVNGFKVISRVIWKNRTVHEFDIQAIFTDYKIF